jgi:hypothetical protein
MAEELHGRVVRLSDVRPIRFVLQHDSNTYHVRATAETTLFRNAEPLGVDKLRYGNYVWVIGEQRTDSHGNSFFSAKRIDVATVLLGHIRTIQKTTPLRLVVETGREKRIVQFSESTLVTKNRKKLRATELRENQYVRIASLKRGTTMVARIVEVTAMVEGEIVGIMEIFPLRLSVKTKNGLVLVQLQENTFISKNSERIEPGKLRNGDLISAVGVDADDLFTAREVIVEARDRE